MVMIDCPCCEQPLHVDGLAEAIRCDDCRVELEFAPDDTAAIAQAA